MVSSTTSSGNSSNVNTLCPRSRPMSGVRVTTRLTMRIRSHGSSRRKRTQTSNTAPPTSSMHSKPASSRMPATGSIWAVVMRVAHRQWCASRNVLSITFTLLTRPSRRLPVLLDPARVKAAGDEGRILEHAAMERDGGGDALHVEVGQRPAHASDGGGPIAVSHDDLGQQRVVERRHRRPGRDVRVDPDALAERRLPSRDRGRTGAEVERGGFGVYTEFDGLNPHGDVGLAEDRRGAGGLTALCGDQIDASTRL